MTTALRATFTTTVRMIDRIHRRAADVRPTAHPAIATGLADHDRSCDRHCSIAPIVARQADGTRRISPLGSEICAQAGLASHQRGARAGTDGTARRRGPAAVRCCESPCPAESSTAAGSCRPSAAHPARSSPCRPCFKPCGREDVPLFAIDVVQQRDAGRAIRIVLDRIDLGRHAVLVATEVDQPIPPLVTAATMPGR